MYAAPLYCHLTDAYLSSALDFIGVELLTVNGDLDELGNSRKVVVLSGVFLDLSWICVIPGSGRDWPEGPWASTSWSDLWKNCTSSFFFCWDRLGNGLILASCCVPNQGGTFDCVSLFTWDGRKDGKRTLLRCYVGFWMRRWDVPCDLLSYFSMWPAVHFCCLVRDWSLSCRDIRRIITR